VTCAEPGCTLPCDARGLCKRHYQAAYYRENRSRLRAAQNARHAAKRARETGDRPAMAGAAPALTERLLTRTYDELLVSSPARCVWAGCLSRAFSRGLCKSHYAEQYPDGAPVRHGPRPMPLSTTPYGGERIHVRPYIDEGELELARRHRRTVRAYLARTGTWRLGGWQAGPDD